MARLRSGGTWGYAPGKSGGPRALLGHDVCPRGSVPAHADTRGEGTLTASNSDQRTIAPPATTTNRPPRDAGAARCDTM